MVQGVGLEFRGLGLQGFRGSGLDNCRKMFSESHLFVIKAPTLLDLTRLPLRMIRNVWYSAECCC